MRAIFGLESTLETALLGLGAASRPKNFFQTHFQKVCAVTAPLESVSRRSSGWSVPCVSIQLTLSQKAEYSQSFSLSTFRIRLVRINTYESVSQSVISRSRHQLSGRINIKQATRGKQLFPNRLVAGLLVGCACFMFRYTCLGNREKLGMDQGFRFSWFGPVKVV